MRCCGGKGEKGFGTLEGALVMVFLLMLVGGVFALVSYLERTDATKAALDVVFSESGINPMNLAFSDGTTLQAGATANVNREGLANYLSQNVNAAGDKLSALSTNYLVEAGYVVLSIDRTTGQMASTQTTSLAYRVGNGPGVNAPQAMSETELAGLAASKIDELRARNAVIGVPTAVFGLGQNNYVGTGIVVVARALVQLNDGLTRETFAAQGKEPVALDTRAVVFRGDVQ